MVLCKIFLFALLIFPNTSQDFQALKTPLEKETLTVPFQWKDLTKHEKEFRLDHRKLQLRQNMWHISILASQTINETVIHILLPIHSGS